ncbi:hypothetical protein B0G71_7550 [Paraburkholderia sp. BL27I4N3]|nr:hypothetical protein B0G71_7550 [Paraburkholderia sp. BL27I4N3]
MSTRDPERPFGALETERPKPSLQRPSRKSRLDACAAARLSLQHHQELTRSSHYVPFASFHGSAMRETTPVPCRECTRREYAIARLRVAMARLIRADSAVEMARATCWANAWGERDWRSTFSRIRRGAGRTQAQAVIVRLPVQLRFLEATDFTLTSKQQRRSSRHVMAEAPHERRRWMEHQG